MTEIVLLKYGEIVLKGTNRGTFENILVKNIKRRLNDLGKNIVNRSQSTITVKPDCENFDMDEAYDRLSKVFGFTGINRAVMCNKDFEEFCKATNYFSDRLESAKTFKVCAKRSDKTFPMDSPKICMELGGYILDHYENLKVDVHNPELTIWVEVRDTAAYVHADQMPGAGGLPVGCGGKAALLLSGGIDSPVAGYMMAKRGLEIFAIHFASPPYTSERAKLKVMKLCQKMAPYTGRIKLLVVPFTEIQDEIAKNCPEEYFTLIMRRFMMEIASKLGSMHGAEALITGESLGQVASQTVQAIACTDSIATLPVLRPEIGMDKEEIVRIARKIDTFETSILPYEDCCTVFTPRHPRTHPKLDMVIEAENALDRESLINKALEDIEEITIDTKTEFSEI